MKKTTFGWLAACFFIAMALFPQSIYQGARQGLNLWAEVLVPSMLPFFILAEILMASGLLNRLGFWLSPIMEPLFHLPGTAGLGLALGYTSGFPMGTVISSRLYKEGYLDRQQAARLLAFTNNASPGFVLTSLAAGMLKKPAVGGLILFCHYGANIIYGFFLGRLAAVKQRNKSRLAWGRLSSTSTACVSPAVTSAFITSAGKTPDVTSAASAAAKSSSAVIITESIRSSIQNMLNLGGFVMIFSALLQLFTDLKLLWLLAWGISSLLPPTISQGSLAQALAAGLFEMTLGLSQTSQVALPLTQKIYYCLLILGWSGFSIQAQVLGIAGSAHLNMRYYLAGRIIQPLLSIAIFQFIITALHIH
jgi:sporulation integral membrane protein YlbJ